MNIDTPDLQVLELRQYTLHPGRRDDLIELFEREFIETQEAQGLHVLGQFRDLDAPDRFAWLRGFASLAARRAGLQAFYGGPVWAAHRHAANATMIDSDDVWLLRPAWQGAALRIDARDRPAAGAQAPLHGHVRATIAQLRQPAAESLLQACRALPPGGALRQGWYTTEPTPNDYPRLPVHEGQPALVHLALYADEAAVDPGGPLQALLYALQVAPLLVRRWAPTARSALHA